MSACPCSAPPSKPAADQRPTRDLLQASSLDELRLDHLMQRLRNHERNGGPRYRQVDGVLQLEALIQHAKANPQGSAPEAEDHA